MKIGIDISQIAHEGTGVAAFIERLVGDLLRIGKENEYVLFFSSLRKEIKNSIRQFGGQNYNVKLRGNNVALCNSKVKIKSFRIPPTILDFLWNKLHILPIEWLIGDIDIFITSDWTEPPTVRAKKTTILYDLIVYKYSNEADRKIVEVQKRKLKWVKKESDLIFCISESTKKDAMEILGIEEDRLRVILPGI